MTTEPTPGQQDFRLMIGPEPFDPAEVTSAVAPSAAGTQATIVQFAALLSEPDIARLKAAYGLQLDRFIPNLAFLERLDTATADRVRADFLARAVIALPQATKLSPTIPTTGPLDLIAILFDDADPAAVSATLTTIGAHDLATVDDRAIRGRLHLLLTLDDATKLAQVAAIGEITWLESVPTIKELDVEAAQTMQSGTVGPLAGTIWDRELHGEGQVIGIIEEGTISLDHCFFADATPNTPGPGHRKVLAVFNDIKGPAEEHFVTVAGIAAGDELGNSGDNPHRGFAWAAKIVVRNRRDRFNKKVANPPSLQQLLETSKNVTATIHNLSWAGQSAYDLTAREVDAFSFANEDQLVIAAGENSNDGTVNLSPAIGFNTICVAAAGASPNHLTRSSGVDGPSDGRRKPDLMAVGEGITTATLLFAPPSGPFCDTALALPATSWATPNASAAAALVRQYFQQGYYPDGERTNKKVVTPSGALLKAVLLNSTVDMTGHPGYPSNAEGWGLIQLDRTLFFGGRRKLWVKDVRRDAGLRFGETRTYNFFVRDATEQLKISFVWTNPPPAEPIPAHPAVRPIRFEVEDPLGGRYLGNDFVNGVSRKVPASPPVPPDIVNNVQMIVVNNPLTTNWTIRLSSFGHMERLGFALVVSGGLEL